MRYYRGRSIRPQGWSKNYHRVERVLWELARETPAPVSTQTASRPAPISAGDFADTTQEAPHA